MLSVDHEQASSAPREEEYFFLAKLAFRFPLFSKFFEIELKKKNGSDAKNENTSEHF